MAGEDIEKLIERANTAIKLGETTGADGARKSPTNIYVIAAELRTELYAQREEIERLRDGLERIARDGRGLQGIIEDERDGVERTAERAQYWYRETQHRKQIARAALARMEE